MIEKTELEFNGLKKILYYSIAIMILWLGVVSIRMHFSPDEFEHIHSAWLVLNGYVPFKDFFQNHNPLFWYTIAPFIKIFGNTITTVISLRIFMLFLTVMIGYVTYKIGFSITNSKNVGLLAMGLLLTTEMFYHRSIEVRPDVPQVLFGMIAIYYLLSFLKTNRTIEICLSGFCLALSFLFLQKSIFLIMMVFLLIGWKIYKKEIRFLDAIWIFGAFLIPLIIYGIYLMGTESIRDYLMFSWISNFKRENPFSPFKMIFRWLSSSNLWFLMPAALLRLWVPVNNNRSFDLKFLSFVGLGVIASTFLVPHPFSQYFMMMIPPMCLVNADYLYGKLQQGFSQKFKVFVIVFVLFVPLVNLALVTRSSNERELKIVDYITKQTTANDYVYDLSYNLFRKDPHFLWMVRSGLIWSSNYATNNRYKHYDPAEVIKEKWPRFVNEAFVNSKNGLDKYYEKSPYSGIAVRKDTPIPVFKEKQP